jgi:histidinol-phosphate aminotransferase
LCYNCCAVDIARLVRPNINSLSAYQAKEIPCRVKLDANESPYGLSRDMLAILSSRKGRSLFSGVNRYPDPEAGALKKVIARNLKVRPENLLQGNGSDELIYYLITTFGGPVLFPTPTFSMYGIIAQAVGEVKVGVPLDQEFDLDMKRMLREIRQKKPKLIFLSTPNNPTGNCFSCERILRIMESGSPRSIIVVDEAYQPFASEKGFIPLLRDYENLLIMRTLSKIGLAGLRAGFLIGNPQIINEVNKVRLPFNLNSLSQAIAEEVMRRGDVLKKNIRSVVAQRGKLFSELSKIEGVKPYPSEANFILFRVTDPDIIYEGLLNRGVLVRNMRGVVDGCLRVTVGRPEENRIFIDALKNVIRDGERKK